MKRYGLWQRTVVAVVFVACVPSLWAAGTTTNSLVVNGDAVFRGDLKVVDPSTGSAPTNGLVLYYSFGTNATPVPDDSGNGHTGTVYGATWVTNGITGGAYNFDGSNDYISVTGYKGVLGARAMSVSAWARSESYNPQGQWIVMWGDGAVWGGLFGVVYRGDADHSIYGAIGGWSLFGGQAPQADELWHHVAMVTDGNVVSLFIDGQFASSVNTTNSMNVRTNVDVLIGQDYVASVARMDGSIDEVRIYDRALSTNEVESLYLKDAHLRAGTARFETGVSFVKPLGDILMGIYTNSP